VKLGPGRRTFVIRNGLGGAVIFNQTLDPGSAVTMTVPANNATSHEVPPDESTELSGSIVFWTIDTAIPVDEVIKKVKVSDKTINDVVRFVYNDEADVSDTDMQIDGEHDRSVTFDAPISPERDNSETLECIDDDTAVGPTQAAEPPTAAVSANEDAAATLMNCY
jgi:hypothetical protein